MPIVQLRQAAAVLRASGDPAAIWLANAIARYEEGAAGGETLDGVLGLSRSSGAGPWWVSEARQRRDQALRELRERAFADLAVKDAALAIARAVQRRSTARGPARTQAEKLADQVLVAGCRLPGRRQVIAIIQGSRKSATPSEFPGPNFEDRKIGLST
jgi:hypothetical protein